MVNLGAYRTRTLSDGWTVVTVDGSASAHFEHTVLTTDRGPEVLTIPRLPLGTIHSLPATPASSAAAS
jgi:methionyl aminopeptidase